MGSSGTPRQVVVGNYTLPLSEYAKVIALKSQSKTPFPQTTPGTPAVPMSVLPNAQSSVSFFPQSATTGYTAPGYTTNTMLTGNQFWYNDGPFGTVFAGTAATGTVTVTSTMRFSISTAAFSTPLSAPNPFKLYVNTPNIIRGTVTAYVASYKWSVTLTVGTTAGLFLGQQLCTWCMNTSQTSYAWLTTGVNGIYIIDIPDSTHFTLYSPGSSQINGLPANTAIGFYPVTDAITGTAAVYPIGPFYTMFGAAKAGASTYYQVPVGKTFVVATSSTIPSTATLGYSTSPIIPDSGLERSSTEPAGAIYFPFQTAAALPTYFQFPAGTYPFMRDYTLAAQDLAIYGLEL